MLYLESKTKSTIIGDLDLADVKISFTRTKNIVALAGIGISTLMLLVHIFIGGLFSYWIIRVVEFIYDNRVLIQYILSKPSISAIYICGLCTLIICVIGMALFLYWVNACARFKKSIERALNIYTYKISFKNILSGKYDDSKKQIIFHSKCRLDNSTIKNLLVQAIENEYNIKLDINDISISQ